MCEWWEWCVCDGSVMGVCGGSVWECVVGV